MPTVPNAAGNTRLAVEGNQANYSCVYGYEMAEGAAANSLWCADRSWQGIPPVCEGNWKESDFFQFK